MTLVFETTGVQDREVHSYQIAGLYEVIKILRLTYY